MVEAAPTPARNVIDFAGYRQDRASKAQPVSARLCRHCGAAMGEGDSDDDCSSANVGATMMPPRRMFRAE